MQEDELVLSDVHVGLRACSGDDVTIHYEHSAGEIQLAVTTSKFPFRWPLDDQSADTVSRGDSEAELDEDGDSVVRRRPERVPFEITIEHSMASPLPLVGLQVWAGALLMCDYVLHNRQRMTDKVVLELGAGTGICSIVAAIFARKVFCTDYDHRVLRLCQRNVRKNAQLIQRCSSLIRLQHQPSSEPENAPIEVRTLDWQLTDPFGPKESSSKDEPEFGCCAAEDRKDIEVILAADVIYDDGLTDSLFRLLERLVGEPPKKTVLISLERRLNFTLEKLDVSCPAHDHFLQCLAKLPAISMRAQRIPTDFPQYFDYERSKYLELWEISS